VVVRQTLSLTLAGLAEVSATARHTQTNTQTRMETDTHRDRHTGAHEWCVCVCVRMTWTTVVYLTRATSDHGKTSASTELSSLNSTSLTYVQLSLLYTWYI